MAYEASRNLYGLMKSKVRGKLLHNRDFEDYLEIIAREGHIPYNSASLDTAIDIIFKDINKHRKGKETEIGYLIDGNFSPYDYMYAFEKIIYQASKKHDLNYTPEGIVKRVITKTRGYTEKTRKAEEDALKLLDKAEHKTRARKPEVLGAAALYAVFEGLKQREISEYSFCTEVSIRNAVKELRKIGPEFFDKSKLK